MTSPADKPEGEAPTLPVDAIFNIQLRSGIWGVKLDGIFYGDFRSLRQARESVEDKARGLRTTGRGVQITILSAGGGVLSSSKLGAIDAP
jgi:hypothetical protein